MKEGKEDEENPLNHLLDKLLPRWLFPLKQPQTRQQLSPRRPIGLLPGLPVHVHQQDRQVSAAATLAGPQQRLRHVGQDVDCCRPVGLLGVARRHQPRLLRRLVLLLEGALRDALLQAGDDLFDLGRHSGWVCVVVVVVVC